MGLEESWRNLAQGKHVWVIRGQKGANKPDALKKVMSPYKRGFNLDEIYKMASEPGTFAVITAAQSYDGFEAMRDRAKRMGHASMKDILNPKKKTYLKYTSWFGNKGVERKVRSF